MDMGQSEPEEVQDILVLRSLDTGTGGSPRHLVALCPNCPHFGHLDGSQEYITVIIDTVPSSSLRATVTMILFHPHLQEFISFFFYNLKKEYLCKLIICICK